MLLGEVTLSDFGIFTEATGLLTDGKGWRASSLIPFVFRAWADGTGADGGGTNKAV